MVKLRSGTVLKKNTPKRSKGPIKKVTFDIKTEDPPVQQEEFPSSDSDSERLPFYEKVRYISKMKRGEKILSIIKVYYSKFQKAIVARVNIKTTLGQIIRRTLSIDDMKKRRDPVAYEFMESLIMQRLAAAERREEARADCREAIDASRERRETARMREQSLLEDISRKPKRSAYRQEAASEEEEEKGKDKALDLSSDGEQEKKLVGGLVNKPDEPLVWVRGTGYDRGVRDAGDEDDGEEEEEDEGVEQHRGSYEPPHSTPTKKRRQAGTEAWFLEILAERDDKLGRRNEALERRGYGKKRRRIQSESEFENSVQAASSSRGRKQKRQPAARRRSPDPENASMPEIAATATRTQRRAKEKPGDSASPPNDAPIKAKRLVSLQAKKEAKQEEKKRARAEERKEKRKEVLLEKRRKTERLEDFASPQTRELLARGDVWKHCLYSFCNRQQRYRVPFPNHRAEFHREHPDMKQEIKDTKICSGADCDLCTPSEDQGKLVSLHITLYLVQCRKCHRWFPNEDYLTEHYLEVHFGKNQ